MSKKTQQALADAKIQAQQARSNLQRQLIQTRQRFQPERLKDDALNAITDYIDDATEITVATIKEHPVVFGTSFLGTLAFWYRKPLIRKSPDAIDSVGTGLAKLRDWVAPESWTPSASDKE